MMLQRALVLAFVSVLSLPAQAQEAVNPLRVCFSGLPVGQEIEGGRRILAADPAEGSQRLFIIGGPELLIYDYSKAAACAAKPGAAPAPGSEEADPVTYLALPISLADPIEAAHAVMIQKSRVRQVWQFGMGVSETAMNCAQLIQPRKADAAEGRVILLSLITSKLKALPAAVADYDPRVHRKVSPDFLAGMKKVVEFCAMSEEPSVKPLADEAICAIEHRQLELSRKSL